MEKRVAWQQGTLGMELKDSPGLQFCRFHELGMDHLFASWVSIPSFVKWGRGRIGGGILEAIPRHSQTGDLPSIYVPNALDALAGELHGTEFMAQCCQIFWGNEKGGKEK